MSILITRAKIQDGLTLTAIIGAAIIASSLIFLTLEVDLFNASLAIGLNFVFPLLIVGVITLALSVKVLEWIK